MHSIFFINVLALSFVRNHKDLNAFRASVLLQSIPPTNVARLLQDS